MPDCIGCHITKPTAHFAKADPLCRMCRATLDEVREKPRKPRSQYERVFRPDEIPWRDQADLLRTELRAVAKRHGVSPSDILGRNRRRYISVARVDLYRRLHKILRSTRAVSDLVGRDHSTVNLYCRGARKDTQRTHPPVVTLYRQGVPLDEIATTLRIQEESVWMALRRSGVIVPFPSNKNKVLCRISNSKPVNNTSKPSQTCAS